MKEQDIKKIITQVTGIGLQAVEIAIKNDKEWELKCDKEANSRAIKALKELKWQGIELNNADGMTTGNTILWNSKKSVNWGSNYTKMVLLHELAHYFTHKVSLVPNSHCRTWFYWQHIFNGIAFGKEKASKISYYNLARYTGPLKDAGEEKIMKFAKRIGINSKDEIDYDILGVKNYCSNILKQEDKKIFLLELKNPKTISNEDLEYLKEQTKLAGIKNGYLNPDGTVNEESYKQYQNQTNKTILNSCGTEWKEKVEGVYLIKFERSKRYIIKNNNLEKQVAENNNNFNNVSEEETYRRYLKWKKQQEDKNRNAEHQEEKPKIKISNEI